VLVEKMWPLCKLLELGKRSAELWLKPWIGIGSSSRLGLSA